ncbi:MAG: response regulator [Planctomycetales bacterium]
MSRILIVGDEPENWQLILELLQTGFDRLVEVADGPEGLRAAQLERPELIIVNTFLPTMDGADFVRQLRGVPSLAGIPVVMTTVEYHQQEARRLGAECGVVHILPRPCRLEVIEETLHAALRSSRVQFSPPAVSPNRLPWRVAAEYEPSLTGMLSANRLQSLTDASRELAEESTPERLLRRFCDRVRELAGAKMAIVGMTDECRPDGSLLVASGIDVLRLSALDAHIPPYGLLTAVMEERRCRRLRNPSSQPAAIGLPPQFPPVQSLLCGSINSPSRSIGWFALIDRLGSEEFSPEDQHVAWLLASQVGYLYENAHLNAEIMRRAVEMELQVVARIRAQSERKYLEESLRTAGR